MPYQSPQTQALSISQAIPTRAKARGRAKARQQEQEQEQEQERKQGEEQKVKHRVFFFLSFITVQKIGGEFESTPFSEGRTIFDGRGVLENRQGVFLTRSGEATQKNDYPFFKATALVVMCFGGSDGEVSISTSQDGDPFSHKLAEGLLNTPSQTTLTARELWGKRRKHVIRVNQSVVEIPIKLTWQKCGQTARTFVGRC